MGERIEVEAICGHCQRGPDDWQMMEVRPNSLTAARLRLAEAAEAWDIASLTNPSGSEPAWIAYVVALAALRTKRAGG